jgi:hypothetical protein
MSDWRALEIYATFMKVTGELEVIGHERLTDSINRFGDYMHLRNARSEPLSENSPVISRIEERTTVAKAAMIMVCPVEDLEDGGNRRMWREKDIQPVSISTAAFTLVADVHVEPRHSLQDQLERFRGDFLPGDRRLGALGGGPRVGNPCPAAALRAAQPVSDPQLLAALTARPGLACVMGAYTSSSSNLRFCLPPRQTPMIMHTMPMPANTKPTRTIRSRASGPPWKKLAWVPWKTRPKSSNWPVSSATNVFSAGADHTSLMIEHVNHSSATKCHTEAVRTRPRMGRLATKNA